ncbi:hypothetical protein FACS1894186_4360 [Alphaproteobacteria bacterium]|nr:hypothetical protein FACS1894186_4360 [Alphaproteobacteria bacterium]
MFARLQVVGFVANVRDGMTSVGQKYIKLSVANNQKYADKNGKEVEKTDWYSFTLWNEKQVDFYRSKPLKGAMVLLEGEPDIRLYNNNGESRLDIAIKQGFNGIFKVLSYGDKEGSPGREAAAAGSPAADPFIQDCCAAVGANPEDARYV